MSKHADNWPFRIIRALGKAQAEFLRFVPELNGVASE
jgi:hypothetical protein